MQRRRSGKFNRKGGVLGLVNDYNGDDMIFPGHTGFTLASVAPPGWLPRDGRAISRTVYAGLFAAIGTLYGAGDGSSTFNLPDDRGNVDIGADLARGIFPGLAVGGFLADGNKSHGHTTAAGGAHSHGASTDVVGAHSHGVPTMKSGVNSGTGNYLASGTFTTGVVWDYSQIATNGQGSHQHAVTVASVADHSHAIAAEGNTYASVRSRAGLPIIKY